MANGIKKEVLSKDAARVWINDDIKMQTFSHSLVSIIILIFRKLLNAAKCVGVLKALLAGEYFWLM